MMHSSARMTPLREDQGTAAAALLARAFHDQPLYVHVCPDAAIRARWLPWHFRWSAWAGFAFGETVGTPEPLHGVAVAIRPGSGEFSATHLAHIDAGRGREELGAERWDRLYETLDAIFTPVDAALQRAVPEPHWHLGTIGVDPPCWGRGIGGSLLRVVHARSDADGLPIALITRQPRNVPFYHGHGYRVTVDGIDPGSGLHWWLMKRESGG